MSLWGTQNQLNAYRQDEVKERAKEHLREAEEGMRNIDYNKAGKTGRKPLLRKVLDGIIVAGLLLSIPILILFIGSLL